MSAIAKYWRPWAASLAAGALALSLASSAFAQAVENQAPAPANDVATTAPGTAVAIDVLANDSDPDGQGISITEWSQPEGGTVDVIDAIVHYTPGEGFTGDDTFEYTVSDGELAATATATVTVTVGEASVELVAANDEATTAVETAVQVDVLANDTGAEGVALSIDSVSQPANGTAEVVDALVTYTPGEGFSGTDTFEYTITDGEATATAIVTVTVEQAAAELVAANDEATTAVGTAVQVDVLANDTGAEGVELSIDSVTQPANGTAEMVDGLVTYTPGEGFTGTDTFEYTITDGEATATATVTVTVEPATPENLDPRVVEACEAYTGDDSSILLLCRVYMTGNLSPFVQPIMGSIILLTIPVPQPDPVIAACEANVGDPIVDALCNLYRMEAIPDWLKDQVGDSILQITGGDGAANREAGRSGGHGDDAGNRG